MAAGRQRNIRKKELDDTEADDQGDGPRESVRDRLETAKVIQRQRARAKGMEAGTLAVQKDELTTALAKVEGPLQNDMLDTFAKEEVLDELEEDPSMHKYVEEQMEKRLGVKKKDPRQQGPLDPEQALYQTPDDLRVEAIKPQEVAGSWLTGISEVQLPAQYKLQNIEETEAAKLRLLRPSGSSEEEEEDSDYEAPQAEGRLPRGAYPRGFGHENKKDMAVRKTNLIRKSDPAYRHRRAR